MLTNLDMSFQLGLLLTFQVANYTSFFSPRTNIPIYNGDVPSSTAYGALFAKTPRSSQSP